MQHKIRTHTKATARCTPESRRSHPSVRARNRGNPLPTRNTFAGWRTTFRELPGRSVYVDGAVADLEIAIDTPTADPRGDEQEHRRRVSPRGDRARGRSRGLMRAETRSRRRFVSQRAAITGGRSPVTSVSDCGCRSRGRTRPRGWQGEGARPATTGHAKIFNLPLRVSTLPTPSELANLADRAIDTRDTKFFTLTGRFSRRPRPIFSTARVASRRVATLRACRPAAARH